MCIAPRVGVSFCLETIARVETRVLEKGWSEKSGIIFQNLFREGKLESRVR